jgi:CRISPR/Cas system-associated endonuclease Cas1
MEPYRPTVDRGVLSLVRRQAFTPRDFVKDASGVCQPHPELARAIVATHQVRVAPLDPLVVLTPRFSLG